MATAEITRQRVRNGSLSVEGQDHRDHVRKARLATPIRSQAMHPTNLTIVPKAVSLRAWGSDDAVETERYDGKADPREAFGDGGYSANGA
jgi:hypothetical protein